MASLINISLMTYFIFVAIIGTLGNGVILLAYGNRWNSSKSTSVIFILILACVDLWTCSIVVPTIAIVEHRDFDVPTPICRFYSFSKNLIIISSFIMSFIAIDRFCNIALPHYRLLNPRRVKVLLILFISIGIGLGTLAALAFSPVPIKTYYLANYNLILPNESYIRTNNHEDISLEIDQNSSLTSDTINLITAQISIPNGANITILNLEYKSTLTRCFADTTIVSETLRDLIKHISNKAFYTLIGIVTIFYTITYVLALQRLNPRIRALKKSLNVLNRFDAYPPTKSDRYTAVSIEPASYSLLPTRTSVLPEQTTVGLNELHLSEENLVGTKSPVNTNEQQHEMSKFINNDDSDDQNLPSPIKSKKLKKKLSGQHHRSPSNHLHASTEKLNGTKQVSFQVENHENTLDAQQNQHLSISTVSLDVDLDGTLKDNTDMYYKFPCPCSTTRQLLVKFHFARPPLQISKCLCCCCCMKKQSPTDHHHPITIQTDDEPPPTILAAIVQQNQTPTSSSETLRRQLHRHRLQQIRMASTFLLITVSFVVFYLPSVLNAERIIRSPIMIYYLFLCTHALNPVIYCFMNPSLRAYVISMFNCWTRKQNRNNIKGRPSFMER